MDAYRETDQEPRPIQTICIVSRIRDGCGSQPGTIVRMHCRCVDQWSYCVRVLATEQVAAFIAHTLMATVLAAA